MRALDMRGKKRNAIAHWALVVVALALAALRLSEALEQGLRLEAG